MNAAVCYTHRDRTKTAQGCSTCRRIALEQRIVRRTVGALLAAGYRLNVDNGGDEPELAEPTIKRSEILAVLMETDDEYLIAEAPDGRRSWVRFVYGNDGYDVISDYTLSLEDVLKPINDYCDTLY